MKIGIFLGSFDPLHIGHESVIMNAITSKKVDKVIIVPAYHNPWKENAIASFKDRFNMCRIVADSINEITNDNSVETSSVELAVYCMNLEEKVFTSDVLKMLKQIYKGDTLCILCGTDVKNNIKNWHEGQWIIDNFEIIDVGRPGEVQEGLEKGIKISSTTLKGMLSRKEIPYPYISKNVYEYIKSHGLYS